ncbi:MAG: galactose-1-phosphate uridylyltransferase, partial [Planctomycetota bacterium]
MIDDAPHRRRNPLNDSWVLVSPHRTKRPWQGQVEAPEPDSTPAYIEDCYLCPGNTRAGGVKNPDYDGVWVFDNDFPALLDAGGAPVDDPLLGRAPVAGTCRVICYSPSHNLTMSTLPVAALRDVVDAWAAQHAELSARYDWVQILENRGAMMGCSNPHPHGQIWATDTVPTEPAKKRETQRAWHA